MPINKQVNPSSNIISTKILPLIAGIFAILGLVYILSSLIFYRKDWKSEEEGFRIQQLAKMEKQLDSIRSYNISLVQNLGNIVQVNDSLNQHSPTLKPLSVQLSTLEKAIEQQNDKMLALRQAIDPIHPKEILTIARLKDEMKVLDKKNADVETHFRERQGSFEEAIKREVSA